MKTTGLFLIILSAMTSAFSQGFVIFANTPSTLISVNGTPMQVSGDQQFIFAIFIAPSMTANTTGITPTFSDPVWQLVCGYNTNSASAPGRLVYRGSVDVGTPGGYFAGSTVDFIVRGWSANAGATWGEASATWNNGMPLVPLYIGSSTVGDNLVLLGGTLPYPTVFGLAPNQVLGFDMLFIPEPSTLALAFLGGLTLFVGIRHPERQAR